MQFCFVFASFCPFLRKNFLGNGKSASGKSEELGGTDMTDE